MNNDDCMKMWSKNELVDFLKGNLTISIDCVKHSDSVEINVELGIKGSHMDSDTVRFNID